MPSCLANYNTNMGSVKTSELEDETEFFHSAARNFIYNNINLKNIKTKT